MKTTKEKRDLFIAAGSEIKDALYHIFKKEDPLFIADIGACDGLSSIIYANMFPRSLIVAFEPVPENFKEMNDNFKEYGIESRTLVHNFALGDKPGRFDFYKSYGDAPGVSGWETGNKSGSLLPPKLHLREHSWCKFEKVTGMEVRTLDSLKLDHVDFMHIDVQGAELKVLRGAQNTLRTTKAIWIEVATVELYAGQVLKNDLQRFLNDRGFVVERDTCQYKRKYGDMLWVRR